MAKRKKPSLSTVVAFMSDETQARVGAESAGTESEDPATIPLEEILPDIGQPRRLLPEDLARTVSEGILSPLEAVQEWMRRAEAESADVGLRRSVQELKRLADSIAQHGLISPISVREPRLDEMIPPPAKYLIVTGERRFWAQVYLTSQDRQIREGKNLASPAQIKVTLAPPGVTVRAHQLIENLMREDINAIERARGLWALRYELSGVEEPGTRSRDPGGAGGVNHGSPPADLVPWSRVEEVLGVSKRYRIFMSSVLNLAPEAQAIVARHNLAERTIRPIVQKLKGKPALQVQALNQLVAWQQEAEAGQGTGRSIVGAVKNYVDQMLTEQEMVPPARESRTRAVSSAPVIRLQNQVRQTLTFLSRLKEEDRVGLTQALNRDDSVGLLLDLRHLRQQIDQLLESAGPPESEDEARPSVGDTPQGK